MRFTIESNAINGKRNWSNLPRDIVESIMMRLCLSDFLQFGEVCTYWRMIVADAIATKHCLPAPQAQLPVMITSRGGESKLFNLTTKKLTHPKRPVFTENQQCLGVIEGWLIMFESSIRIPGDDSVHSHLSPFFFLNTVSNVRISFPEELNFVHCPFSKMVASSSPNCKDCFIAGQLKDFRRIAFCRLEDKPWTVITPRDEHVSFLSIEFVDSKLCALVCHEEEWSIRVYDLQDLNTTEVAVFETIPIVHEISYNKYTVDDISYVSNYAIYYIGKNAVSGELLLIRGLYDFSFHNDAIKIINHTCYIYNFIHPPSTKELRLWKYQFSDSKWVQIDDLGNCSIFLGINGFTVISINRLTHQELVERNSIYFAHWKSSSDSSSLPWELEIGTYSLTDESMKYFDTSDVKTQYMAHFHWLIPSLP